MRSGDKAAETSSTYKKEEEQRRLLLLLAVNEEYQKDMERAEDYYRQLLLYEPEYREGYTEYGMFLWKKGDRKKQEAFERV